MDAANRKALKKKGFCVWLTADVKAIIDRMRSDKTSTTQRPPLSSDSLEQETAAILEARWPFYKEMADYTIDTSGKNIEAIVDEIVSAPGLRTYDQERSRAT